MDAEMGQLSLQIDDTSSSSSSSSLSSSSSSSLATGSGGVPRTFTSSRRRSGFDLRSSSTPPSRSSNTTTTTTSRMSALYEDGGHGMGGLSWLSALQALLQFRNKRREEKKKTLKEILQSKTLQRVILVLVILDLVIVAVSVQFPDLSLLALLNAVADRGLLVIFLLEALALLYVQSPREYIRNPWHVIDGAFISVSLVLEIHELTVHEDDLHPASPFVSLSIRVWRILRIVHAFTVALELEYQEARNSAALEDQLREALQKVSVLESELYHEKHARAALERELARLNRVKRSYDALGVRVPL